MSICCCVSPTVYCLYVLTCLNFFRYSFLPFSVCFSTTNVTIFYCLCFWSVSHLCLCFCALLYVGKCTSHLHRVQQQQTFKFKKPIAYYTTFLGKKQAGLKHLKHTASTLTMRTIMFKSNKKKLYFVKLYFNSSKVQSLHFMIWSRKSSLTEICGVL